VEGLAWEAYDYPTCVCVEAFQGRDRLSCVLVSQETSINCEESGEAVKRRQRSVLCYFVTFVDAITNKKVSLLTECLIVLFFRSIIGRKVRKLVKTFGKSGFSYSAVSVWAQLFRRWETQYSK